ncbi:hypothetical protein LSAT2_030552 [Lamellibrachia satsuma]|nr:hypothetical protein LSAT2_030552 [Lamellibrachia satsuma]
MLFTIIRFIPSELCGDETKSTKMISALLGPGLVLALVSMEMLNHLYMSGAIPQFLDCDTGKLPFSIIFNFMLYVMFENYLPVEVNDLDTAASAAWTTAVMYAIVQGQKTVGTLEEFGHVLPEMVYVFLLTMARPGPARPGPQVSGPGPAHTRGPQMGKLAARKPAAR